MAISVNVGVRLTPEMLARVDAIATALAARNPGTLGGPTRADAVRACLARGVEVVERELGLQPASPVRKVSRAPRRSRETG